MLFFIFIKQYCLHEVANVRDVICYVVLQTFTRSPCYYLTRNFSDIKLQIFRTTIAMYSSRSLS